MKGESSVISASIGLHTFHFDQNLIGFQFVCQNTFHTDFNADVDYFIHFRVT